MTNSNFKVGDTVNWLVCGKVALRGLVIKRLTINGKSAWVSLVDPQSVSDEMVVNLENLEAA